MIFLSAFSRIGECHFLLSFCFYFIHLFAYIISMFIGLFVLLFIIVYLVPYFSYLLLYISCLVSLVYYHLSSLISLIYYYLSHPLSLLFILSLIYHSYLSIYYIFILIGFFNSSFVRFLIVCFVCLFCVSICSFLYPSIYSFIDLLTIYSFLYALSPFFSYFFDFYHYQCSLF